LTFTPAIPASAAADKSTSRKDIQMVAPALDKYTQDRLLGEVWKRPGLSPRDRSIAISAATALSSPPGWRGTSPV